MASHGRHHPSWLRFAIAYLFQIMVEENDISFIQMLSKLPPTKIK